MVTGIKKNLKVDEMVLHRADSSHTKSSHIARGRSAKNSIFHKGLWNVGY